MSTITKPKPKTKPKALKAGQEPRARRSVQAGFMMPLTEVDRESALDVLRHRCATLVRDCSTLTLDEAEKYIGEQLHRNRVGAFRAEYPGEPLLTTNQRGVVVEHQGRRGTLSWLEIAAEWVAAEEADADPSDTREAAQVRPFYGSTELGLMGSIELWQTALGQWVYLARARFAADNSEADHYLWVMLDDLAQLGATPRLIELIRCGAWIDHVKGTDARRITKAISRYGPDILVDPKIRVGTIHSVKGQEADKVVLLTTTSAVVERGAETRTGRDEEHRVAYVAATRARRELVLLHECSAVHCMQGLL